MKLLLQNLKWDTFLIYKYGIVYIALCITLLYSAVFLLSNMQGNEKAIVALIFTDPVMYGFLFTAIIMLFDKDARIHEVFAVTTMPSKNYIISKAIIFTMLALFCSLVMIVSAAPVIFHLVTFILAVVYSSLLFVFVGIIAISYVNSFNQFILTMPIVMAPVCLPFLDYFDIFSTPVFYLIPTQACLLLFKASVTDIALWQIAYAIVFLTFCCFWCYKWAVNNYKKQLLKIE